MLYSKAIDEISFDDVVEFLQRGLAEGLHLDYKLNLPKAENLAKTIAAFANTLGGLLIIGVNEENERPIAPFEGIKEIGSVRNRISNIISSNITPPPFVEVADCRDAQTGNVFVVIRVPPSVQTPHSLLNRGVYVRTGESSLAEDLASPERIRWLFDSRKQSEDFRQNILEISNTRAESVMQFGAPKQIMSIVPLFPGETHFDYVEAEEIARKIAFRDRFDEVRIPPIEDKKRSVPGGMLYYYSDEEKKATSHYTEINNDGLFYHRCLLMDWFSPDEFYDFHKIVREVTAFFIVAIRFYSQIGYWGSVRFSYSLQNLKQHKLRPFTKEQYPTKDRRLFESIPDESVSVAPFDFYPQEALLRSREFVVDRCHEIAWSLGLGDIDRSFLSEKVANIESIEVKWTDVKS